MVEVLEARWVRNAQLARHLGCSVMTIWRWQRDSRLNFPKPTIINGIARTDLNEVDAWMRERAGRGTDLKKGFTRASGTTKQRTARKQDAVRAHTAD
jgi:predicted DNA-binding transcriptional regulator AlpA